MIAIVLVQVLILIGGIVWYLNRTTSEYQATNRTGKQIYEDACISCHPIEEFDGRSISVEYTKRLVRDGKGVMPKYSNIKEPELTKLGEYVNQL